jgi:hypothetical protein
VDEFNRTSEKEYDMPIDDFMGYKITAVNIFAQYKLYLKGQRAVVIYNGNEMYVEKYVATIYRKNGYTVIPGEDLSLALYFSCGNYPIYPDSNPFGLLDDFINLNNHNCELSFDTERNFDIMLLNGIKMWNEYFFRAKRDSKVNKEDIIRKALNAFTDQEKVNLLKLYISRGYDNGAPDLFVFKPNTKEKQFVEVKSLNDRFRFEQLTLAEKLTNMVGNVYSICHVMPYNQDELMLNKVRTFTLKHDKEGFENLKMIPLDILYKGFMSSNNRELYAGQIGVSYNCLSFYLHKMNNCKMDYKYNNMDKLSEKEYMEIMGKVWNHIQNIGSRSGANEI